MLDKEPHFTVAEPFLQLDWDLNFGYKLKPYSRESNSGLWLNNCGPRTVYTTHNRLCTFRERKASAVAREGLALHIDLWFLIFNSQILYFRIFFINPFSAIVLIMHKPGSWLLLAKCLKNTYRKVTFLKHWSKMGQKINFSILNSFLEEFLTCSTTTGDMRTHEVFIFVFIKLRSCKIQKFLQWDLLNNLFIAGHIFQLYRKKQKWSRRW